MRSEFPFPAAVWSCVHPTMRLQAPEFTLRAHHLCSSSTGLILITEKDRHAALGQNDLFGDKYPEPKRSLWKFLCTGISFQLWDTMSCPCFCKISASSRTVCDSMGTALKGTCKGQCARFMALFKGQIRAASSKSYLPKLNCCSISCPEPHGSCSISQKSRNHS